MSELNDKCRKTTKIAASRSAEPIMFSTTTRKRKDLLDSQLTPRSHKRKNFADYSPPTADSNSYVIATTTKCFRISGIPQDWKDDDLLGALRNIDPDLRNQKPKLSLYPACCSSSQTALLELDATKYFQSLKPTGSHETVSKTEVILVIDSHFYGLTPLNTPDKQIVAELVASCLPRPN